MNGDTIHRLTGGFIDYFQMLFDQHQIIYAEGIAAESMIVDSRTRAILPNEMADMLGQLQRDHRQSEHGSLEVSEEMLSQLDAAAVLRKSSGG